ncbi:hypothetical protein AYO45_02000 [Gammaproteobacteria bacterium SCGC AG-212-F23]|nr:hypothetical protein AYO45_02000 [Gammaproteobacteria bacterium SCGC AG-212-F23]
MVKARVLADLIDQTPLTKSMQMTLASLHLEGIKLSPESIADLQLVEAGKLSKKEAVARILARVQK